MWFLPKYFAIFLQRLPIFIFRRSTLCKILEVFVLEFYDAINRESLSRWQHGPSARISFSRTYSSYIFVWFLCMDPRLVGKTLFVVLTYLLLEIYAMDLSSVTLIFFLNFQFACKITWIGNSNFELLYSHFRWLL